MIPKTVRQVRMQFALDQSWEGMLHWLEGCPASAVAKMQEYLEKPGCQGLMGMSDLALTCVCKLAGVALRELAARAEAKRLACKEEGG